MKLRNVIYLLLTAMLAACSDSMSFFGDHDIDFEEGEAVLFTTSVPDNSAATRATLVPDLSLLGGYRTICQDYTLTVSMYEQGNDTPIGTCDYKPMPAQVPTEANGGYDEDGQLVAAPDGGGQKPLYWHSNVMPYAFEATAGTATLEADQSTPAKWLAQDRLHGYAFMPLLDEEKPEDDRAVDNIDARNYHTNVEWGRYNKAWQDYSGAMLQPDDYKRIPLFLRHQRAWITVILRAGEGVSRDVLKFATAEQNIRTAINSYAPGSATALPIDRALASEALIDYGKDKNGEAESGVSTTRYDAIVMPHNYYAEVDPEVIAKINLSQQNFSFYATNDHRFVNGTDEEKAQACEDYDLKPGKHLTLEVTLSRDSRKILVTAWVEDWTEVATSTICDDYGQNGDPIVIKTRQELIDFLASEKTNRQGSVGIIQPTQLNLDLDDDPWTGDYDLNATLNLAGSKLVTAHRLFNKMSSSANLVNGTVAMSEGASVDCAIARCNEGTIERVNVLTSDEATTARATVAGMVEINYGTIYQCTSTLPVRAVEPVTITGQGVTTYTGYVGGIAAVSVSQQGTMAVIDGCTVNAFVGRGTQDAAADDVKGGGIVGLAAGRVSGNTFEYGITVSQKPDKFKNIFYEVGSGGLRAYANGWPTTAQNPLSDAEPASNPNRYAGTIFDAVIESRDELAILISNGIYNMENKNYRLSKGFTVSSSGEASEDWDYGKVFADDLNNPNNVRFNLDGNDKTITLDGTKKVTTTDGNNPATGTPKEYTTAPMLFNYVLGEIKDLTIYVNQSIVASPSVSQETGSYNATDAIAPLAYAIYGETARLSNIKVKARKDGEGKNDVFVQASTPGGLVVWAYGGATITGCKVQVPVRMWLPKNIGEQSKHYAGGIAACAAKALVTESVYMVQADDALCGADSPDRAKLSPNFYYGGIVGGTATKGTETPSLQITDCTSWFIALAPQVGNADQSTKAAIIAYPCYATTGSDSKVENGMDDKHKSEGNWWLVDAVGAGYIATGLSEEQVIGKRNSVTPTFDNNF